MPKPKFHFDHKARGLPRQPVPVRIACLAADWTPKLFARLVNWSIEECGKPLIDVYAFDESTHHVSEVTPSSYSPAIKEFSGNLPSDLLILPANHFVWSDEFVSAFSGYIDNVFGREDAWEGGYGIRWTPEVPDDCATAINECVDLSSLIKVGSARIEPASNIESNEPTNPPAIELLHAQPARSVISMRPPKRSDDWFMVIHACILEFENEHHFTPTELELWQKLHSFQNAARGGQIGSTVKSKEKHLTSTGLEDLGREAFSKRYKRLYPP